MKNIEATERAAAIAAGKINPVSTQVQFRFNSHERAPKLHPSMEGFIENPTGAEGIPGSSNMNDSTNNANKRPLKSSDDRALEQYKKVKYRLFSIIIIIALSIIISFTIMIAVADSVYTTIFIYTFTICIFINFFLYLFFFRFIETNESS